MRDPAEHMQQKKKEAIDESWSKDTDVVHLTGNDFLLQYINVLATH